MYPQVVEAFSWPYDASAWSGPAVRVGAAWASGPAVWTPGSPQADALNPVRGGAVRVVSDYWGPGGNVGGSLAVVQFSRLLVTATDVIELDVLPAQALHPGDEWTPSWQTMVMLGTFPVTSLNPVRTYASTGVLMESGAWRLTFRAPRSTGPNAGKVVIFPGFRLSEGSAVTFDVVRMHIEDPAGGLRRLRQRQTLTGADSWPLRQRQNGGHSGSWPLRQRQTGV